MTKDELSAAVGAPHGALEEDVFALALAVLEALGVPDRPPIIDLAHTYPAAALMLLVAEALSVNRDRQKAEAVKAEIARDRSPQGSSELHRVSVTATRSGRPRPGTASCRAPRP